ncbi:hypothetical protein Goklo_006921 [Gossypium klotzschianum]|uniref:Uncharacterized protein n=1 Tax=Gossypium klotzschianum TaxID=34286 RepID=A0A7J8VJT0_9ROSI|nr:hypothetical protein [Gossypium klotzschianum]
MLFSWLITPQWKVFFTASLISSNSSRRRVTSTKISNRVCSL